jgi:hypothetical protein
LILGSADLVGVVLPIASALGGMVGAFIALTKLMPERSALIVGYQTAILTDLNRENRRQAHLIADLENRVATLENNPPHHLS